MFDFRKSFATFVAAASLAGLLGAAPAEAQTLKVVMHSDVKILDPIWTTAYIQRNHGYMVWDTLFAMDEKSFMSKTLTSPIVLPILFGSESNRAPISKFAPSKP